MLPLPGSGVRPGKSNVELLLHNDNAYNHLMPGAAGLLCNRAAPSGGISRVMRFATLHITRLARHSALEGVFGDQNLQFAFSMRPGDLGFAKNRENGHGRTAFVDDANWSNRLLLVRLRLRDVGTPGHIG